MSRQLALAVALVLAGLGLIVAGGVTLYQPQSQAAAEDGDGAPDLVIDQAELFDDSAERRIADYHRILRENHDIDYRVLTVSDVGDIDRYAAEAFRERGVGTASEAGHGLLLVIDPAEDVLRIEVSRSLEPTCVDAFVAYIEQRQMTEFFAQDRVPEGILATTEMIVTRAQRAEQNKGLQSVVAEAGSAGGGARTEARLDDNDEASTGSSTKQVRAEGTGPLAVLDAYRRAMDQRNDNPNLAIYSRKTREFMSGRPMTPAQADNTVKMFRRCSGKTVKERGDRAVVRYPISQRRCPPHFLVREGGRWRLDLATMSKAVRMNTENEWRMANMNHPYMFAFSDWRLSGAGIPVRKASADSGANAGDGRSLVVVREVGSRGAYRAKTPGMKIEGSKRGAVRGDGRFVAFSAGAAKRSEDGPWRQHYVRLVCIDNDACWERGARLVLEADGERFAIDPGRYRSKSFDKQGASGHMTRIAYRLTPAQLTALAEASSVSASVSASVGDYGFEFSSNHRATFTELHQRTAP